MTRSMPPRKFFHREPDKIRPFNASLAATAAAQGYRWMDVDANACRAHWVLPGRLALAVHWGKIGGDGYADPLHKLLSPTRWSGISWSQARRLRHQITHERPYTIAEYVAVLGAHGFAGMELEAKDDKAFESPRIYAPILTAAKRHKVEVQVKTLASLSGGLLPALRRLRAAKKAGATTILLNHNPKPVGISPAWLPYVDYVRGPWTPSGSLIDPTQPAKPAPAPARPTRTPVTYLPPSPPFIGARHHGGSQTPRGIVIHATVSPDTPGTARKIAQWWNGSSSPVTSAHYIVDPTTVVQCVGDHTVAYHCGYNTGSIGIELCDEQTGPANRWRDANSTAILTRAADLVAQLCLAYGIEPSRPSIADLKAHGPHGIYGHDDSRRAFGRTTHTDPRDFDWPAFLAQVRAAYDRRKETS